MDTDKVVHIEALPEPSYLIRVGGEGWKFGDPYEVCMVLVELGGGACEIRGLDKPIAPSHWKAIRAALKGRGYSQIHFVRMRDGVAEKKLITL